MIYESIESLEKKLGYELKRIIRRFKKSLEHRVHLSRRWPEYSSLVALDLIEHNAPHVN